MDFPTEGKEDPDEPSVSRAGDIELIERDRSSNFDNRMSPDHQQNLYYQALWKEIPETEHVGRSIQTTTLVIIATSCIGVVLIYLKSVLLPFLMATLIYYLLIPVVNYLTHEEDHCNCCFTGRRARVEKWTRLNVAPAIGADPDSPSRTYLAARSLIFCLTTGKFPRWLAVLVAILLALSVILFVVWIILSGLHSISKDLDMYVQSFRNLISGLVRIVQGYGVEIREEDVYEQINKIPIEQIAISLANAVLSLLKSVAFMIIFVIYLLMERSSSNRGVSAGKQVSDLNMRALGMKKDINMQVRKYISVKTFVSLVKACSIGIILAASSIPLAGVFGLLTFVLNFIPNIGSTIATALPATIVILDPGLSTAQRVVALLLPLSVHFIVGTFIEPMLFGEKLELHPIIILLALTLWGAIWGVVGMILAVPITAVIKIVSQEVDHFIPRFTARILEGKFYSPGTRESSRIIRETEPRNVGPRRFTISKSNKVQFVDEL